MLPTCSRCPAFLFSDESFDSGLCMGCRSGPPQMSITHTIQDTTVRTPHTWAFTFMQLARSLAKRSKDDSTQVGAVLTDPSNRIIGMGFNGPPPMIDDELVPWQERPAKYDFIMHADENALWDAVSKGQGTRGSTMYLTGLPCVSCLLRIIKAECKLVIFDAASKQPNVCGGDMLARVQRVIAAMKSPKLQLLTVEFTEDTAPIFKPILNVPSAAQG